MAKNLSELPVRTTAADSDLLHINTGGTNNDYKMTRANFLSAVTGDIADLMKRGALRTVTDPDEAIQWGFVYGINGSSSMPNNGYWVIVPIQYSVETNGNQIAFLVNTIYPQMWVRSQNSSGTWGEWYAIYPEPQTTPTYTLGSGLSGTPVIARYGKIVVVSMTLQVTAAKTFSSSDALLTITPPPVGFTRSTVATGGSWQDVRIDTGGRVTLNNSWTASAGSYILGQIVYVTA